MAGLAAVGAAEVDVRLTQDGHLILAHDPLIECAEVASASWEEYALLPPERRPTLLDHVMALPGRLDLEVKNLPGEPGFDPSGRAALLTASRLRPSDILTSFFWPDMDRVRQIAEVATGLIVGEGGSVIDAVHHACNRGHNAVFAHETLVTETEVAAAEKAGVQLGVWTVDDVERARELSGMGVATIISNDPRLLKHVFAGVTR